ncbi:hypothetical protein BCR43DRAFT_445534 [Syncephalastrum racemosum]|uniref:rRNA-processing protein n=1 Tax=Syncephalastrum racemosum TaxID=13706 RepID=A0A1X2H2T5_SYNRA|nr:hypothetical protein BCR43DRAFT_445534 [Syncephalastrum racemosum]
MAEIPKSEAPLDLKEAVAGVVDLQHKRVSGKSWKLQKTPTVRAQKTKHLRRTWAQRSEERAKQEAVKAREREMKDEIQAEKDVRYL